MEEDIKILEEFIKYFEAETTSIKYRRNISITVGEDDIQAIENLINRVKELEEENNSWKKYCIEDLEKQITNLNNKNFELEEKQQVLDDYQDLGKDLAYNFIPKSKIREKIEELENIFDMKEEWYTKQYIIEVLQEILEDI